MDRLNEINELRQEISELRSKLMAHEDRIGVEDKVAAEVKTHREFLESMTDRALKWFGLALVVVAGAVSVIGIKSFSDITDKADKTAAEKVEKYLSERRLDAVIQERINEYNRAAVLAYYSGATLGTSEPLLPPDAILERVLESALNLTNKRYIEDCARIVGHYSYFKNNRDLSKHFGDLLEKVLVDSYLPANVPLDDSVQAEVIQALVNLKHTESGPALWTIFKGDRATDRFRVVFAENFASLISGDALIQEMVADIPRKKTQNKKIFADELIALLLAQPDNKVALTEIRTLAEDKGWGSAETLEQVLSETALKNLRAGAGTTQPEIEGVLTQLFYSRRVYFGYYPFARTPSLTLWFKMSESGASGTRLSDDMLASPFFADLIKTALSRPKTAGDPRVLMIGIVSPLTEYYSKPGDRANLSGTVDLSQFPFQLDQPVALPEAGQRKVQALRVTAVAKDGATLDLIGSVEGGPMPFRSKVRLDQIDISKLVYIHPPIVSRPGMPDPF